MRSYMHFLLSLIFNLDFKPLFVLIEASSGSVYNIQYAPTHEDRDLPIRCLFAVCVPKIGLTPRINLWL